MSNSKPVWLNRESTLYTVVLEKNGERSAFLVLTAKGPIMAKTMAEQAGGGTAIKSQHFPFPLLTPDQGEIDGIVDTAGLVARLHNMHLYRFTLTSGLCLVWTSMPAPWAQHFAEKALGGLVTDTFIVTNPIIVDKPEEALKTA